MTTRLEIILSNSYKDGMIAFLGTHPEYFVEAIELALGDKQPYSWRAAWLLWSCMEENDDRIQAYITKIIDTIPSKKDGHQRELMKILTKMELNEDHEGYMFNLCMSVWEAINKRPSVRYNALVFILKMAKKHPDLLNEIAWLTQDQYLETLSPGIRHSVKRMVKQVLK